MWDCTSFQGVMVEMLRFLPHEKQTHPPKHLEKRDTTLSKKNIVFLNDDTRIHKRKRVGFAMKIN
jgi:hypothetical protein